MAPFRPFQVANSGNNTINTYLQPYFVLHSVDLTNIHCILFTK